MQKTDLARVLKGALKRCQNPTDYKAIHLAKVVKLEPLIVSIYEDKILLEENVELYISEWFRFRCNIDKDGTLSSVVPNKGCCWAEGPTYTTESPTYTTKR